MILKRLLVFAFMFAIITNAQKKQDVLFTVDKEPVYSEEFLRIFNKNRDIVEKENRKTLEEYLDLYINYKLKLKQAYQLKLDTLDSYKKELHKYKEQLIKPYLKDANITDELVKEAYYRTKNEIKASHILLRLAPKASSKDTLRIYNKLLDIRKEILNGRTFSDAAKEYSEDPSVKNNGGELGYFSAFNMVYPFESTAYDTKVGEVSTPFRTSFGYHIVQVNDIRPSKGEIEVAHIMIKNDTVNVNFAHSQINDIYEKLLQGEDFTDLAQKFSDDKTSAPKGGRMQKFSATRMIEPFSSIAFSLKKEDEISKPFKTRFGWHIVRLIKKYPIPNYNDLAPELIKKIERSERAYAAGKSVAKRLRKDYKIIVNNNIRSLFLESKNEKIADEAENTIFTINGKKTYVKDLIAYNSKQQQKSLQDTFEDFLDEKIIKYYKENLEHTNLEFANTIQEYKDGLLLFDLLQLKVWKRSETDTIGLRNFYNANKLNYMYKKRIDVIIGTSTKEEKAIMVKELLESGKSIEEIKSLVNKKPTINVLFSRGIVDVDSYKLPENFNPIKGVSKVFNTDKNQFVVVKVNNILEPTVKEYKEAKGLVMNDYQDFIEKEWIKVLRASSEVKVNNKILKKLKKQYQNN